MENQIVYNTHHYVFYLNNRGYLVISDGKGNLRDYGYRPKEEIKRMYKKLSAITGLKVYKGFYKGAFVYQFANFKSILILTE